MMNMKILGAVAALALLAGCTSNIDQVSMAKGTGSPFTQALTSEYQAYVAEEKSEYDWGNADHFAQKGLLAAGGANVEPEDLANWDIPADKQAELAAARTRLMTALNSGARDEIVVESIRFTSCGSGDDGRGKKTGWASAAKGLGSNLVSRQSYPTAPLNNRGDPPRPRSEAQRRS